MINPPLLWLIAGSILCLMELVFPTAFVAFMMGVSAILIAVVSLLVPYWGVQVLLWLLLSTALVWLSRRWFSPQQKLRQLDAQEGETLTDIPLGQPGRVLYEGNSWRAICADETIAIAPQQKVYIVQRKGNTLIVLPNQSSMT